MALTFKERVLETTTTTGTGTLTLAGAVAGFQAWSAVGNANTAHYAVFAVDANGVPTGDWEVGLGTYTLSGTTLARTTVYASSNAGSLVSFAAGTKRVALVLPTQFINVDLPQNYSPLCEFRVSTENGVGVSPADRTAQSLVYAVPYKGNRVRLMDSGVYVELVAAQITSGSLTGLTNGKHYDWLLFRDSGVLYLDIGPAWASDSSRGTGAGTAETEIFEGVEYNKVAVTTLIQSKSVGARAGIVLGTCRTTGTTTIEDSLVKRFLCSAYNQVPRRLAVTNNTSHSYGTNTVQAWNNDAANSRFAFVLGQAQSFGVTVRGGCTLPNASYYAVIGASLDSSIAENGPYTFLNGFIGDIGIAAAHMFEAGLGYHEVIATERGITGSSTFSNILVTGSVLM